MRPPSESSPGSRPHDPWRSTLVRLEDLHLTYPGPKGAVHALRGIDLDVAAGEVLGIIGRSGAGKSSLVRCINLLNRPSAGRVWLAGQELTALDDKALREARRGIGMVFQHFNLLASRTVFENLALPLVLAGFNQGDTLRRVLPLLELVGLEHLRDRYPAQISSGEKQRVGIARALANRPRLLLCDDVTSALDPEAAHSILQLLGRVGAEFSLGVVLATRQIQAVRQVAHRVAVIDEGRIVEQGPLLRVISHPRHPSSRSLLADIVAPALPERVLARLQTLMADASVPESRLLRLVLAGDEADRPWLSELVRRYGVDLNIVHGQVDEIQGQPFGALSVLLRGRAEQLDAALAHLQAGGLAVQVQALPAGASARVPLARRQQALLEG